MNQEFHLLLIYSCLKWLEGKARNFLNSNMTTNQSLAQVQHNAEWKLPTRGNSSAKLAAVHSQITVVLTILLACKIFV